MARTPTTDRYNYGSKIEKTDTCWLWKGANNNGYGVITRNNEYMYIHRYTYQVFVGDIPDGFTIDHLCSNKSCVNPEHLEAVTLKENIYRSSGPAAINRRKTHCKNGHELMGNNLYICPSGKRNCRPCSSASSIASHARLKKERELINV